MSNKKDPLISVITPYYNPKEEHFKDAVNSVITQSYENWELIIVNDGSNKQSTEFLIKLIKDLNDPRIRLIHLESNYGTSYAKNTGVENTKGEIITFLDSDDLHLPWYYEGIVSFFTNNTDCSIMASSEPYIFSFFNIKRMLIPNHAGWFIKEKNHLAFVLDESIKSKLIMVTTPRLAIKKEVFSRIKFDNELKTDEDCDLCLQILNQKDLLNKTYVYPDFGYLYRIYSSRNRLTQRTRMLYESKLKILSKYTDKNLIAYKILERWKNGDSNWRFCHYLSEYTKDKSLVNYTKSIFWNSKSRKEKVQGIRALLNLIITYNIFPSIFSTDYHHLKKVLFKKNAIDKTKEIKWRLTKYYNSCNNEDTKQLLTNTFKKIIF